MVTPATLADLRADLRKLLGDPLSRRYSDDNLAVALGWAAREACRMKRFTVAYHTVTGTMGTNLFLVADPGLGVLRVGEVQP